MGLLDSFEKRLERAVNSAFAKSFRSGIQPVGSKLQAVPLRELEILQRTQHHGVFTRSKRHVDQPVRAMRQLQQLGTSPNQ